MGRKRTQHNVQEVINEEKVLHSLDLKEEDGLYPFSAVWRWRPQSGKGSGELVSLTIDSLSASPHELAILGNHHRVFYSEHKDEFPWAVNAMGRGLKTVCFESRCSKAEASYKRNAVGLFFEFCRRKQVQLNGPEDLNFLLMCEWRADMRSVDMDSRYKSAMFRRCSVVIERIMGTPLMPNTFVLPVYTSDAPEALAPYSDAVMYQLISAVTSDIEALMYNAKEFSQIMEDPNPNSVYALYDEYSSRVLDVYRNELSFRASDVNLTSFTSAQYQLDLLDWNWEPANQSVFEESFPYVCPNPKLPGTYHLMTLAEREVPSRESLFPFLVFLLIFSGKNLEVVMTWKRRYMVKGFAVSPLDWKDPFDPNKCRLRGYKGRGKGRGVIETDDTYVTISGDGIYPILSFLLWYTEPLSAMATPKSADSLWLYFRKDKAWDYHQEGIFYSDAKKFLMRHEIWDLKTDASGNLTKERVTNLDSRRFRKVFADKELLKAIGESRNHQELHATLSNALNHKSFDTTLGSYLAQGASRKITDIAIFTLQHKYLEEARKFRGVMLSKSEQSASTDVAGFYASCADPTEPDFEGAMVETGSSCHEYDMCMGCGQSRVFEQHLPRIATRILQYESLRPTMSGERWETEYGRKHARAHDLLTKWSDQDVVAEAWASANSGAVFLPAIIARG
ncbi:hypothetical protein V2K35_10645 [Pseudomonas alliivorans]|nr:hypothetical protein [Pseudomonas alliivorans]MEE4873654.1 hypothetical protein [Pseudomonas alliivorans]